MKRSSSLPEHKRYSNGLNNKLPKITRNPWLTNSSTASDYKYMRGEKFLPQNYMIMNRDKLKAIENNYYDMRYLLNNKINRLEKNQRKFNEILQYSLEQNRLQNDINSFNYNKHIQNYKDKNRLEKEYLINVINQMPEIIENKIDKIFMDEYESSQNQKQFLENLKERMISELKNQRRYDYMKYKHQLNELLKLKDNEEKEKIQLLHEIQNEKLKYEIKAIKYQNQMNRYNNPYPPPIYPIIQQPPSVPASIGSSIDEFMKLFLFKEMMGSYQRYNDYQNYLYNFFPNIYGSLGDTIGFREYQKFKNIHNKLNSKRSHNSNEPYNYRYLNKENSGYTYNNNSVPFINTGKSYSKIKGSNKNNKMRFMTSHDSVNNESEKKIGKKEKEKKSSKKSKSRKSNTKSKATKSNVTKSKETKSSVTKSNQDDKSSGSEGSEKSKDDNSDKDSNTEENNDNNENTNGQEKKEDNNNTEENKEEEKKEETGSDNDDDSDNNNEEEKKEEGQEPKLNLAES